MNKKILMIGPDINFQGGISSVISLYNKNNLYNNQIIYLASYQGKDGLFRITFYLSFLIKYIFHLTTNKNIKLIHIHTASRGSFLRKSFVFTIAKLFGKKTIIHIHGAEFDIFYNNSPAFIKKIITKTLNAGDLIIVLSKQWKEKISEISSNPNIKVLYNPTIIKELNQTNSDKVKFLFMGRLGKRKGTYDIIDAAKYVNSNIEINLYGDGNIEEFEKLIQDNNLQEKIKIKGWISGNEKEEVFKNSNILLLPSYSEGLPMSILEAMAYGLPIISTPVGGIPEAVVDNVNGFLIQPGDCKALAEKIDILATDNQLREKMGEESYRMAQEKFDIKVIAEQLGEFYDSLLK